jgi:hypothetical protein
MPDSAAFASARFHAARLLIEAGKKDEARVCSMSSLNTRRAKFDGSTINLLLSQRMRSQTAWLTF